MSQERAEFLQQVESGEEKLDNTVNEALDRAKNLIGKLKKLPEWDTIKGEVIEAMKVSVGNDPNGKKLKWLNKRLGVGIETVANPKESARESDAEATPEIMRIRAAKETFLDLLKSIPKDPVKTSSLANVLFAKMFRSTEKDIQVVSRMNEASFKNYIEEKFRQLKNDPELNKHPIFKKIIEIPEGERFERFLSSMEEARELLDKKKKPGVELLSNSPMSSQKPTENPPQALMESGNFYDYESFKAHVLKCAEEVNAKAAEGKKELAVIAGGLMSAPSPEVLLLKMHFPEAFKKKGINIEKITKKLDDPKFKAKWEKSFKLEKIDESKKSDLEKAIKLIESIPPGERKKDGSLKEDAKEYENMVMKGYKGTFEQFQDRKPRSRLGQMFYTVMKALKKFFSMIGSAGGDFFEKILPEGLSNKLKQWREKRNKGKENKAVDKLKNKIDEIEKQEAIDKIKKDPRWETSGLKLNGFYNVSTNENKLEESLNKLDSPEDIKDTCDKMLNAKAGTLAYEAARISNGIKFENYTALLKLEEKGLVQLTPDKKQIKFKNEKGEWNDPVDIADDNIEREGAITRLFHGKTLDKWPSSVNFKVMNETIDMHDEDDLKDLMQTKEAKEIVSLLEDSKVQKFLRLISGEAVSDEIGTGWGESGNISFNLLKLIKDSNVNVVSIEENPVIGFGHNPVITIGSGDLIIKTEDGRVGDFDDFEQLEKIYKNLNSNKYLKPTESESSKKPPE